MFPQIGIVCPGAAVGSLCRTGPQDSAWRGDDAACVCGPPVGFIAKPIPDLILRSGVFAASRRMGAAFGLAAILRDARKSALLRMRSESYRPINPVSSPKLRPRAAFPFTTRGCDGYPDARAANRALLHFPLLGSAQRDRHSGAMRSIEPGIPRFRVWCLRTIPE
jgi:hypothetical protein